jgi:hypothetical protein
MWRYGFLVLARAAALLNSFLSFSWSAAVIPGLLIAGGGSWG